MFDRKVRAQLNINSSRIEQTRKTATVVGWRLNGWDRWLTDTLNFNRLSVHLLRSVAPLQKDISHLPSPMLSSSSPLQCNLLSILIDDILQENPSPICDLWVVTNTAAPREHHEPQTHHAPRTNAYLLMTVQARLPHVCATISWHRNASPCSGRRPGPPGSRPPRSRATACPCRRAPSM